MTPTLERARTDLSPQNQPLSRDDMLVLAIKCIEMARQSETLAASKPGLKSSPEAWDLEILPVKQTSDAEVTTAAVGCQYELKEPHKNNTIRVPVGGSLRLFNGWNNEVQITLPADLFLDSQHAVAKETGVVIPLLSSAVKGSTGKIKILCKGGGGGPDLEVGDP